MSCYPHRNSSVYSIVDMLGRELQDGDIVILLVHNLNRLIPEVHLFMNKALYRYTSYTKDSGCFHQLFCYFSDVAVDRNVYVYSSNYNIRTKLSMQSVDSQVYYVDKNECKRLSDLVIIDYAKWSELVSDNCLSKSDLYLGDFVCLSPKIFEDDKSGLYGIVLNSDLLVYDGKCQLSVNNDYNIYKIICLTEADRLIYNSLCGLYQLQISEDLKYECRGLY
jgi:hypothetical protein